MSLDNVHIPIRDGRVLSIANINRKLEIVILDIAMLDDEFFVTDSYFDDLYEGVIPFYDIRDLKRIIDHIIEVEDKR